MSNSKVAKSYNAMNLSLGVEQYMTVLFDGPNGFYYDPIGDEIFHVQYLNDNSLGRVYAIDFGDDIRVGNMKDHGFHLRLD